MSCVFVDSSKDRIVIYYDNQKILVSFQNIEEECSRILSDLYKQIKFQKVFFLSGPGTYTNMRVSVLALQSLNYFLGNKILFYSIDKLSFYSYLYQKKIIPQYAYISIGQRKRIARLDCETGTYTRILYTEFSTDILPTLESENCFFVDDFYSDNFHNLVDNNHAFVLSCKENRVWFDALDVTCCFEKVETIEPFYLV